MLQMMPPPLSFFFFSSSRLSPTATARLRDEWWVDSLFLLLWLPRRDFCSLFLLLWLSFRNFRWIFCEERLAQKDTWKSKFAAATFEPSILITFLPWKIFCWYRGLNLGLLPYHVFDAFTVNQHWCRHENQRLVALDVTYWPYPLRFHVEEAGADAKLIQHGPIGVAYHRRHPISTVPAARITAHATVPGQYFYN